MTKDTNFMPSNKTNDEVKAIKEDIQDVFERIGNLKEESMKAFSHDYEELLDKMYGLKDRMMCNNTVRTIDQFVQRHPVKAVLYCIGAGILLSKCFRK